MPDAQPTDGTTRGILDDFGAYRTARPDHHRDLFARGMVVLDTATLLDLYRYPAAARADLLKALHRVRDRLWVPHQALAGFWRGREAALGDVGRATDEATAALAAAEEQALRGLRAWADRVSLDAESLHGLEQGLRDAHGHVADRLADVARRHVTAVADTEEDPVVADLDGLLYGRVGEPHPHDPADEPARRGVWRELLVEATARRQDVLLVTGGSGDGWWRVDDEGNPRGPRPDLYEELRAAAGVRLFLMRPDTFLRHAREQFDLAVPEGSFADVGRAARPREDVTGLERLAGAFVADQGFEAVVVDYRRNHVVVEGERRGVERGALVLDAQRGDPRAAAAWIGGLARRHAGIGVVVFPERPADMLLNGVSVLGVPAVWRSGAGWDGSDSAREQGWLTP
ncbi:PIN-like domain-containing protein [Saccharothrix longispora]|uniref:PIN-like domain-containing protein n=1 Tax=Saccharothrix longispora TaxID=33920 RepID=UPI0028FD236F|nr:PIN-like domain-containing protein [Saccharothrix longispora]MBY8849436.1 hypothetical protein [Saccharothrix sp. MB29]MDU0289360.1 PIN-like domain-containing protein [Saccharothrix longispora]